MRISLDVYIDEMVLDAGYYVPKNLTTASHGSKKKLLVKDTFEENGWTSVQ